MNKIFIKIIRLIILKNYEYILLISSLEVVIVTKLYYAS